VSVSELPGKQIDADTESDVIPLELARINEQLAVKNNRSRKLLKALIIVILAFTSIKRKSMGGFLVAMHSPMDGLRAG
jgi:hypothetical protein